MFEFYFTDPKPITTYNLRNIYHKTQWKIKGATAYNVALALHKPYEPVEDLIYIQEL